MACLTGNRKTGYEDQSQNSEILKKERNKINEEEEEEEEGEGEGGGLRRRKK